VHLERLEIRDRVHEVRIIKMQLAHVRGEVRVLDAGREGLGALWLPVAENVDVERIDRVQRK
jgi:hypothetical protein